MNNEQQQQHEYNRRQLLRGQQQQQVQPQQQQQPAMDDYTIQSLVQAIVAHPEFRNLFEQSTGTAVGVEDLKEGVEDIKETQQAIISSAEDIIQRTKDIHKSIKEIQSQSKTAMEKCLNAKSNKDVRDCIVAITKAFAILFIDMIKIFYSFIKFITATIDDALWWPYVGPFFSVIIRGFLWAWVVYYIYIMLCIIPGVNDDMLVNTSTILYKGTFAIKDKIIDNITKHTTESGPFKLISRIYTESGAADDVIILRSRVATHIEATLFDAKVALSTAATEAADAAKDNLTPDWLKGGAGDDDSKIDEEIDTSNMKSGRSKELVKELPIIGNMIGSITKYWLSMIEVIVDIKLKSIKSGKPISDDVGREIIGMLQFEMPEVIADTYAESGVEQLLTLNNRLRLPTVPENQITGGGMKKSKIKDKRSKSKKSLKSKKRLKSKKHTKSKRKTKRKTKRFT